MQIINRNNIVGHSRHRDTSYTTLYENTSSYKQPNSQCALMKHLYCKDCLLMQLHHISLYWLQSTSHTLLMLQIINHVSYLFSNV